MPTKKKANSERVEIKPEEKPEPKATAKLEPGHATDGPQRPATAPPHPRHQPGPENPTAGTQERETVPGVRTTRTRPYLAGAIIAKHGLTAGVTPAMVAELDETYGKPNPRESQFCLKNAWHACRAFAGDAKE